MTKDRRVPEDEEVGGVERTGAPGERPGTEPGSRMRDPAGLGEREARARAALLPELIRRAVALGLTGFFTTEEAIRKAVGDTLPQDWIDFATDQSERTRAEMFERISQEFGHVLENVDPVEVLERLLEGRTVEVTAQFRLGPRDEGEAGERQTRVRFRVAGDKERR